MYITQETEKCKKDLAVLSVQICSHLKGDEAWKVFLMTARMEEWACSHIEGPETETGREASTTKAP